MLVQKVIWLQPQVMTEQEPVYYNYKRKLLYKEIEDLVDSFDAASKSHSKGDTLW